MAENGVGKLRVLESLFDKKRISVLRVFLSQPEKEFYLREVAGITKVPPATTLRIINLLCKLDILNIIKVSRFKLYRLNPNESTKFLEGFLKEQPLILDNFVEQVSQLEGVERIIIHGKPTQDKANLLIIGNVVNQEGIKQICGNILQRYKFKITSLTLNHEQYAQMSNMGLYSGVKKTLYKK